MGCARGYRGRDIIPGIGRFARDQWGGFAGVREKLIGLSSSFECAWRFESNRIDWECHEERLRNPQSVRIGWRYRLKGKSRWTIFIMPVSESAFWVFWSLSLASWADSSGLFAPNSPPLAAWLWTKNAKSSAMSSAITSSSVWSS